MNYERLKRDCFWDLDISKEQIETILHGQNKRKKTMLFEKILLNSTALFKDLEMFNKEDLKELLETYKIPQFNIDYAFRRKNIAEVYFFDKPLLIDELKWIA